MYLRHFVLTRFPFHDNLQTDELFDSSAITATAPASSATLACSAVTTSMITPPFNISANPTFSRRPPAPFVLPLSFAMRHLLVLRQ